MFPTSLHPHPRPACAAVLAPREGWGCALEHPTHEVECLPTPTDTTNAPPARAAPVTLPDRLIIIDSRLTYFHEETKNSLRIQKATVITHPPTQPHGLGVVLSFSFAAFFPVLRTTCFLLSEGGVGRATGLAVPDTRGHGRNGASAVGSRCEARRHLLRLQPAHDRLVALHTPGSL